MQKIIITKQNISDLDDVKLSSSYLWQSTSRAKLLIISNQAEKIIILRYRDISIIIEKRSIGMGFFGLFIIGLKGEYYDEIKKIENELSKICKEEKAIFFQIEFTSYNGINDKIFSKIKKGYYKKFIVPYTNIIRLNKGEDEILSNMKPKGRYNIKVAKKNNIIVKQVEPNKNNIKIFHDILLETTSRDGFNGNNLEYYIRFLEIIPNSKLFLAYKDENVVAGGIWVMSPEVSIYYYGASRSDKVYRHMMAPYLLQWEAIISSKKHNSEIYDFLGIASPGDIGSSLSGVTDFKLKFSSEVINVSDSYIFLEREFVFRIFQFVKKIKENIIKFLQNIKI